MEFNKDKDMSESEDDISLLKRKNLMMVDCDSSPLEPKQMAAAENRAELDIEKLLLERVMLRKELRLRSVQERLVHTNNKLEVVQDRLLEYEILPGFRQFLAMSQLAQFALRTGGSGAGLVRRPGHLHLPLSPPADRPQRSSLSLLSPPCQPPDAE